MADLSIKVVIAGRTYPLTIDMAEEEMVRKAAKTINDKIEEYEQNYAIKDKQDVLAMVALHFANRTFADSGVPVEEDSELKEQLLAIESVLTASLKS